MLGVKVLGIAYSFWRNESSTGTKVPRSESFWNVRSRGTKVHRSQSSNERMFYGTKVPWERKFHLWTFRSREWKCRGTKNPTFVTFIASFRSCFLTFEAKVLGIFVLMERQFHRNESSWNIRSRGTKVPRERMFDGTKVLECLLLRNESSTGVNVPRNESAWTGIEVLSVDFSLPGTKVQRNEKAYIHLWS